MTPDEAHALAPGADLEWNRGDAWIPVKYVGPASRPTWITARHELMGWEHSGPLDQFRAANRCPTCGSSR